MPDHYNDFLPQFPATPRRYSSEEITKSLTQAFPNMEQVDLDDFLRVNSNVFRLDGSAPGLVRSVSPAGTADRIPPVPTAQANAGLPPMANGEIAPEALRAASPPPPQGSALSRALTGANEFFGNANVINALAAFGASFDPRENSPARTLAAFAQQQVANNAERRYLQRLLRGEDPGEITGQDVAGLTPEGQQRALQAARQRKETELAERRVVSEERDTDSRIEQRVAQIDLAYMDAEEKKHTARFNEAMALDNFAFTVDKERWDRQMDRQKMIWEGEARILANKATEARISLTEAQAQYTRERDRSSGGYGGRGLLDQGRAFNMMQNSLEMQQQAIQNIAQMQSLKETYTQIAESIGPRNSTDPKAVAAWRKVDAVEAKMAAQQPYLEQINRNVAVTQQMFNSMAGVSTQPPPDNTTTSGQTSPADSTVANVATGNGDLQGAMRQALMNTIRAGAGPEGVKAAAQNALNSGAITQAQYDALAKAHGF